MSEAQSLEQRQLRLTRLMQTHGNSVLRVCFLYLHDRDLAQDAAQTTFLNVWKALDSLRDDEHCRPWLMRIAVNTCRSVLRSRQYRQYAAHCNLDSIPEPGVCDQYPDHTVLNAVQGLPDKYREVVVMHYYQGLTTLETAQALRLPHATVRTRLHRARHMLEPLLKGWYQSDA